jgi:chromate transporter
MGGIEYFLTFLKASLLSTGGTGNFPMLHADLLARGCATDHQFAESLAIGQLSPGPSGLWVISLGYLTKGTLGSLLALSAIVIPPLLILVISRVYRSIDSLPSVRSFLRGLTLSVSGISIVVLFGVLKSSELSVRSLSVAAIAAALAAIQKTPVIVIFFFAAIAGILFFR